MHYLLTSLAVDYDVYNIYITYTIHHNTSNYKSRQNIMYQNKQ
jgi:hypothetical protein